MDYLKFIKHPITLEYTNYKRIRGTRKIIPNFIFYGINSFHGSNFSWYLKGHCLERDEDRDFKIDDIEEWNLKSYVVKNGIKKDNDYKLLILQNDMSLFYTSIYHIPELKYNLQHTIKTNDKILFASSVSLLYPPFI